MGMKPPIGATGLPPLLVATNSPPITLCGSEASTCERRVYRRSLEAFLRRQRNLRRHRDHGRRQNAAVLSLQQFFKNQQGMSLPSGAGSSAGANHPAPSLNTSTKKRKGKGEKGKRNARVRRRTEETSNISATSYFQRSHSEVNSKTR